MARKIISEAERMAIDWINSNQGKASSRSDIADSGMNALAKFMVKSAELFINEAVGKLEKQGRINSGNLSTNLDFTESISNTGVGIRIGYPKGSKEEKYWQYVDKGVRGTRGGPNSPFKYKGNGVKVGGKFHKAIELWLRTQNKFSINEVKFGGSKLQKKSRAVGKMMKQSDNTKTLAWLIARSITRKGLKRSGYMTDTLESIFGNDFLIAVAKVASADVQVNIVNGNYN